MCARKMHADEVDTDVSLVGRLLATQFPQWANLPIEPAVSIGTDNAIYRLGDDMAVRLPRTQRVTTQLDKEHLWLPRLAPHLPLAIPVPLAKGIPGEGYPWHWSVYRWLGGPSARKPAGRSGTPERRHRLWQSSCGRSRLLLDDRVDAVLRREPKSVPRRAISR